MTRLALYCCMQLALSLPEVAGLPGAQRAPNPRSRPLAAHCTRRSLLLMPMLASPLTAHAAGKLVVDSSSRFALTIPSGFVASKRSATQGTLYVAGNFPRAAVVSVTAWPVGELLAADAAALSLPGMPAVTPNTEALSAKSLSEIAPTEELARILARQRDREQGGALNSEVLRCSLENGRLTVELSTELPVANPDELEKQRGIRELIRRSVGVATFGEVPGKDGPVPAVVAAWASCLREDWDGDLGVPLRESAESFQWGMQPAI